MRDDHDELDGDERAPGGEPLDPQEYDELTRLERLESLEEEMEELGITSLEQLRAKIAELHARLDEQEGG
ncbi:MAG TPA: hypothetical protein VJQ45_10105 [Ktedonobacterales bacterium]|nr:hypothetical protein [Ktedonobacterales bacterium]